MGGFINTFVVLGVAVIAGGLGWFLAMSVLKRSEKTLKEQNDKQEKELIEYRDLYFSVKEEKTKLETRSESMTENIKAQKELIEEARNKLTESFNAISRKVLDDNSKSFLKHAQLTLDKTAIELKGDFTRKQEAIDNIVKPLKDSVQRFENNFQRLEEERKKDFGSLDSSIKNLLETGTRLQKETNNLVMALRRPDVRGRWGELTLKRVVELAGMSEHCDFYEQESVNIEDGQLRPDMIVRLPNNRIIVIDSKVPLDAYLDAVACRDDKEQEEHMKRHARHFTTHMRNLSQKKYWDQFESSPDFVVMFIPGEAFFSGAMNINKGLIEEGIQNKVIPATPTTLIALLKSVAYGWKQEQIAENALKISRLGKELYNRLLTFIEHYVRVGKSLENTVSSYNKSVGSMERRVVTTARRFEELGISGKEELNNVDTVDIPLRKIEVEPKAKEDNDKK